MSVTKQAAVKTVGLLVERGWVAVDDDTVDRRRRHLRVTDLGSEVMHQGESIIDDLRQSWADELGSQDLMRLEEQLTAFVDGATIRLDSPGWVSTPQDVGAEQTRVHA